MVQGPNDLIPPTPAAPTANTANADTFRRKQVQDVQPAPLQQAADTVQLSSNAVQAAANAKAGGVQPPAVQRAIAQQAFDQQALEQQPLAQQRIVQGPAANQVQARPLAPPAPTVSVAPTAAAPASVFTEKAPPVQSLAAASAANRAKSVLQGEPEVRPDQVQAALKNLPTLTGNSGATNAQLAEKLLTEF